MLDFEPHMSDKIQNMMDQWAAVSKKGPVNAYPWSHWLGFDIVCKLSSTAVGIFDADCHLDNLMFDEDPGSIKAGQPHKVMPYLRAWRPTFIYVSVPSYHVHGHR